MAGPGERADPGCGMVNAEYPGSAGEVDSRDLTEWRSVRTLADLGGLTARWLAGDLGSQPGYAPGEGPDLETAPLVPVLAAVNRAGFVTTGSQPGGRWVTGGTCWEQRAAVEGLAGPEMAARIRDLAAEAGLTVLARPPGAVPRWRTRYGAGVCVSRISGSRSEEVTWFGVVRSRRHLGSPVTGYGACGPAAVRAVCSAWQVAVLDPGWGRDDRLWLVLAAAGTGTEP
jgi:hypothetical protein